MEIKRILSEGNKLKVRLKDVDLSFVNGLRRACTESVPVLAVDTVEFVNNDSVLYDEILAHRIGLVPLKTNLKTLKNQEECTCKGKGCNKCTITLKLSVKGKQVLSIDMKNKAIDIPFEMPIVNLTPSQKLEFLAITRLGTGKEHAKFIPGLIWHTYTPKNFSNVEDLKDESDEKEFEKNDFIFHIESWGQLTPEEIFLSGIEVLKKSFKDLEKSISKL